MDSKKEQFDMILEKLQSLIADQLGVDGNTITCLLYTSDAADE